MISKESFIVSYLKIEKKDINLTATPFKTGSRGSSFSLALRLPYNGYNSQICSMVAASDHKIAKSPQPTDSMFLITQTILSLLSLFILIYHNLYFWEALPKRTMKLRALRTIPATDI